jgi:hypothetical protein
MPASFHSTVTTSRHRKTKAAKVRRYCVVKVFIGLVTPSLLPLESIDSTL